MYLLRDERDRFDRKIATSVVFHELIISKVTQTGSNIVSHRTNTLLVMITLVVLTRYKGLIKSINNQGAPAYAIMLLN